MTISGTYAIDDLLAGAWLHLRRRLVTGAALAFVLCFVWVSLSLQEQGTGFARWMIWVPAIALLYIAILVLVGVPRGCRREHSQRKDFQRQLTFSPSERALHLSTEVLSGERPWGDYLKWTEGRTVFLLYMSETMAQVVPKRFFESQTDVETFRALLASAITRRRV